jgi:hypothetical protein
MSTDKPYGETTPPNPDALEELEGKKTMAEPFKNNPILEMALRALVKTPADFIRARDAVAHEFLEDGSAAAYGYAAHIVAIVTGDLAQVIGLSTVQEWDERLRRERAAQKEARERHEDKQPGANE